MKLRLSSAGLCASLLLILLPLAAAQQSAAPAVPGETKTSERHNILIFITDGLRHDSVNPADSPTIYSLRQRGVDFANSHSLYPTFTTPNASAIATGHLLGDTGDFGNSLYVGRPLRNGASAPITPFIENDSFLAELNQIFNGNYLQEETLMALARRNGYAVATLGKLGPTAIQDIEEIKSANGSFAPTVAPVIDDSTGPQGIPLAGTLKEEMKSAGLSASAPDRSNGQAENKQNNGRSGTLAANWSQQQYFASTVTHALLPAFKKSGQPWLLLFWSRDPDGTQHNQGDSMGKLEPGINGPTSRAAIHNADANLWQILDYLKANQLLDKTDIIVVADHGFSTISKRKIARNAMTSSYAATKAYADVKEGFLPPGFVAIDLAHALGKPLYDSDAPFFTTNKGSENYYQPLNVGDESRFARHPQNGNALIGGTGKVPGESQTTNAEIIVASNGGSDLIYLPQELPEANKKLARSIADFLLQQDYVDGIFVRDDLGDVPGTLPMSAVGLMGATKVPRPAMMVNLKSFSLGESLLTRVEIADTTLQEGQGMHGSFSRADTFNNMVAAGPDFKSGYVDRAPASNADIAVTVAHIMGWSFDQSHGKARGRVLSEALKDAPEVPVTKAQVKVSSEPGPSGARSVLIYQIFGNHTYFDQACLIRTTESAPACK
jgi:arylsulfatase A-like enzyme